LPIPVYETLQPPARKIGRFSNVIKHMAVVQAELDRET